MGCSATCTSASVDPSNGHILVTFSDGTQKEYNTLTDAHDDTFTLDADPEQARKWLIANWLRNDPNATNPALYINGKTCVVNVGAVPQIQVT